jgi:hypothetical protein
MHVEKLIEKLRSQTLTKDVSNEDTELLEAIMADYQSVASLVSNLGHFSHSSTPTTHSEVLCDFQPAQRSDCFSPMPGGVDSSSHEPFLITTHYPPDQRGTRAWLAAKGAFEETRAGAACITPPNRNAREAGHDH